MITLYQVIHREDGQPCGPGKSGEYYEQEGEAVSFRTRLARITGEAETAYEVRPVDVDSLPARKVAVSGSDIGFQFARESMGARSFRRTVTNIRRCGDKYEGEAEVLGQWIKVTTDHIWFVWRYAGDVEVRVAKTYENRHHRCLT